MPTDAEADAGRRALARETAHDLGNVVVALRGFVRLLETRLEPAGDQAELLARIGDCVESLAATTARLQAEARGGA